MRNFKKVLSLVLCMAMMLSVMVVGAGAAFKDQNQIKNAEAVDACAALNIINGYTDGSFKPEGTITRAEACKMICVALNGGKEPALGTSATASFTDTKGHWAEGYIESCVAQGIVAGVGGGKFAPNATVTGSQFAKMLLIALGYNADNQGYVGAAWEVNVNVDASAKGLYADLSGMDPSKALTRDNAAQMVWNALNAYEVEYKYNLVTENGSLVSKLTVQDKVVGNNNDKITLLEDKYEAVTEKGILTSVNYNDNDGTYTTIIDDVDETFDATADYSALMGQQVKVMYTEDNKTNDVTLLGIYATDKNKTVTALGDDIDASDKTDNDATYVEIDNKDYELAASVKVVAPNGATVANSFDADSAVGYYEYTLIDNNNDKDYEYVVVTPFTVEKIDTLTAKKVYFENAITEASTNEDLEDVSYYKDMAEDDYVIKVDDAYTVSGDVELTKAELVSGTVTGVKTAGDIKLDGTWYQNPDNTKVDTPNSNDELEYAVVVNGFYFATDGATGSADKLALVVALGDKNFGSDYYDVKLLLSDGTLTTTKAYLKDGSTKKIPAEKVLYTYTTSSEGYVLKAIATGDDIGLDDNAALSGEYSSVTNKLTYTVGEGTNATTDTARVASDAKVFVIYDTDDAKVVDGATADKWKDADNYKVSNAYTDTTVSVMVVDLGTAKNPSATDDALYGVILDAPYESANADDETTYVIPRLLTQDGIVEDVVVDADEFDTAIVKNMLVTYKLDGSDYVEVAPANDADDDYSYIVGAVTDINGKYITVQYVDGTTVKAIDVKTDSDSAVLYFDSKDNTDGTGNFKKAMKKDSDNYYANVIVVVDLTDAEDDQSYIIKAAAVDIGNQLTNKDEDDLTVSVK